MSANLDLVRSIFAAWERGDFRSTEWAHPNIEFVRPDGPEPGTWIGIPEMSQTTRDILTAWEDFRQVPDEFREVDAERVLVLFRGTGRGKRSGVDLQSKWANVFHLHDGKVTRILLYYDRDRALADLGLEGLAMPEESTTSHLAELLRRLVGIVNRRAWGELADVFARDGVLDLSDLGLGAYERADAIRAFGEDWVGAYDKYEMVMDEVLELDNGVVFTVNHQVARPTGSSGDVRLHDAYVFICEDSRIVRWTAYQNIDEARAAAARLAEERG